MFLNLFLQSEFFLWVNKIYILILDYMVAWVMNQMMGQVNKERLAEFLGELQRKENTNDRYVAALKGETLTRNPYVRIQPIPKQNDTTVVDKEPKKVDQEQKK